MERTMEELERLGRQYLEDKKKKKEKNKEKSVFFALSNSKRPAWIKILACGIVSTGEIAINAAETAVEIHREVKYQKSIRAAKRLIAHMEADGYIENQTAGAADAAV